MDSAGTDPAQAQTLHDLKHIMVGYQEQQRHVFNHLGRLEEQATTAEAENRELRAALITLSGQNTVPVQTAPRISLPEIFWGKKQSFWNFLNQCRLVFKLQPIIYHTEEAQVGLIITLLKDEALAMVSPMLEQDSPLLRDLEESSMP
ncbi:hypothetical protein FKM82_025362 [Ascaphus truei]